MLIGTKLQSCQRRAELGVDFLTPSSIVHGVMFIWENGRGITERRLRYPLVCRIEKMHFCGDVKTSDCIEP